MLHVWYFYYSQFGDLILICDPLMFQIYFQSLKCPQVLFSKRNPEVIVNGFVFFTFPIDIYIAYIYLALQIQSYNNLGDDKN